VGCFSSVCRWPGCWDWLLGRVWSLTSSVGRCGLSQFSVGFGACVWVSGLVRCVTAHRSCLAVCMGSGSLLCAFGSGPVGGGGAPVGSVALSGRYPVRGVFIVGLGPARHPSQHCGIAGCPALSWTSWIGRVMNSWQYLTSQAMTHQSSGAGFTGELFLVCCVRSGCLVNLMLAAEWRVRNHA